MCYIHNKLPNVQYSTVNSLIKSERIVFFSLKKAFRMRYKEDISWLSHLHCHGDYWLGSGPLQSYLHNKRFSVIFFLIDTHTRTRQLNLVVLKLFWISYQYCIFIMCINMSYQIFVVNNSFPCMHIPHQYFCSLNKYILPIFVFLYEYI
jgi:hypothetical protein